MVVDRFSNWFNVYEVEIMRLFQDFGVPETITSNGSPQFTSDKFQTFLMLYGVYHRLMSVGFAHANTPS